MRVFGIHYIERDKNRNLLLKLGLRGDARGKILDSIRTKDYFNGPIKSDDKDWPEYWEFGKTFRNILLYIKISLGTENNPVVCISLHEAERSITFAFK